VNNLKRELAPISTAAWKEIDAEASRVLKLKLAGRKLVDFDGPLGPAAAAVNIFFLADLRPILQRFGNRGYRAVQLEAGILGGKLYLAAYAQRLGATGLTFFDDDVTRFFSPHAEGKSAIFLVALGHSAKHKP